MSARSASAAASQKWILGAALASSTEKLSVEIVLSDVAARARVTAQTVLRNFGSRDE
jgi:AcrR family transcriptional regulator